MIQSEFSEQNYKRIFWVNGILSIPILLLFAWPYYEYGKILKLSLTLLIPGSVLFSLAFMITILHGYVTLSLGNLHRSHYYEWLKKHPFSFGLLYHPILVKTRFRLILILISIAILLIGYF